jgi:hypothetical protein
MAALSHPPAHFPGLRLVTSSNDIRNHLGQNSLLAKRATLNDAALKKNGANFLSGARRQRRLMLQKWTVRSHGAPGEIGTIAAGSN